MKKNISINISGIIFHIEEDGYETLKNYLESIHKYFSSFEDSSEILSDIETRIAEIFLAKLNEEKQVITLEDVSALMATMGSVNDFKAAEALDNEGEKFKNGFSGGEAESQQNTPPPPPRYAPSKQLMRDQKRKILGGVCAGLANYLNVDALWVRLIFALFFFAYGASFFAYIILWLIVPGSYDLEEPVVEKKMFREPEGKIIGGVSGGVAAFFAMDIVAVRVLFILLIFAGGFGFFLYIVLWLILPEARSLTDRVQMRGEAVTLSNIESTFKKNKNETVVEEESALTRILLFPFRLIGLILGALGRVLGPLLDVVRVAIGILVVLIGLAFLFALIVSSGALIGVITGATIALPLFDEFQNSTIPISAFLEGFPVWIGIAGFLCALVPAIFMILLGTSIVAKRIVFNATTGWTLFVLFFISVAMLSVGVPRMIFSFKEKGQFVTEETYTVNGKTAVLKLRDIGMEEYDATRLTLEGHDGNDLRLVSTFKAQGRNYQEAIDNAKMVAYTVAFNDSVFTFDSNLRFNKGAIFRAQRLDMSLFIPYEMPFTMDEGISRFITQYVDYDAMDNETWKITKAEGLVCITCESFEESEMNTGSTRSLMDFDELEIEGRFDLTVVNGLSYKVEMVGPDSEKEKYDIYTAGGTLVIRYDGAGKSDWRKRSLSLQEMRINITMPSLEKIDATGMGSIQLENFKSDDLDFRLLGPIRLRGALTANELSLQLSGNAEADLSGQADNLTATVELASKLRAYNLEVRDAFIDVSGASSAKVKVSGDLEIEEGLGSKVEYRGDPKSVNKHK